MYLRVEVFKEEFHTYAQVTDIIDEKISHIESEMGKIEVLERNLSILHPAIDGEEPYL